NMGENLGLTGGQAEDIIDEYLEEMVAKGASLPPVQKPKFTRPGAPVRSVPSPSRPVSPSRAPVPPLRPSAAAPKPVAAPPEKADPPAPVPTTEPAPKPPERRVAQELGVNI